MTTLRLIPVSPAADLEVVADLAVVVDLAVVADLVPGTSAAAARHVMGLLAAGVPLSLLCDLADPAGPPSADMAASEVEGAPLIGDLLAFRAEQRSRLLG